MVILLKSGFFRPSFKTVIFNFVFNPEQAKIKICFITYNFRGRRINNILELKKTRSVCSSICLYPCRHFGKTF